MITLRPFGWTGVEVAVVGQGTWAIERDRGEAAVAALRLGLDLGMTHIDTAEMYGGGRVEEVVAKAIAGRRDRVFLATKVLPSNASFEGTLRACEQSLKRLNTDWLDLYMLHWPGRIPIRETMRALEQLVADRMVRFIGVSNFDKAELQAAERALRHERIASNQVEYHLNNRSIERDLLPYCAQREIAVVAYSPFGQADFPSPHSSEGRLLADIAKRHDRTPRQVALNFLTRHANVFTIPKATNPDHVRENSGGSGWELTVDDVGAVDREFPL